VYIGGARFGSVWVWLGCANRSDRVAFCVVCVY